MKHSWKAPRLLQELSYRLLPSRKRVVSLIRELDERALTIADTHQYIADKINSQESFLLGRPGGTESEGVYFFLHHRLGSRVARRPEYSEWFRKHSTIQAGVAHSNDVHLDEFTSEYLNSILASDLLAYGLFAPGALGLIATASYLGRPITHHESLEPWNALSADIQPWTLALQGKRVLVVHPFTETITQQYERKTEVSGAKDFLPEFSLEVIKPPVTFAGEGSSITWKENLSGLIQEVKDREFDVALIGAGGYGLPLGRAIRTSGRQAIHLGGITQLLFGITGKRWDSNTHLAPYIDESWVRPAETERPRGHLSVEAGAYW